MPLAKCVLFCINWKSKICCRKTNNISQKLETLIVHLATFHDFIEKQNPDLKDAPKKSDLAVFNRKFWQNLNKNY
jgi:hypothetical protein